MDEIQDIDYSKTLQDSSNNTFYATYRNYYNEIRTNIINNEWRVMICVFRRAI